MATKATINPIKLALASHGEDLLDVRHFVIHDAMNELFEVSILTLSKDDDVDFDSIVGKGACLKIRTPNHQATAPIAMWSGIVADISQVSVEPPPGLSGYHVTLVPTFWRTTLTRTSRIFQHMTTPEIVKALLGHHKIAFVDNMTAQAYKHHEYCVQYDETDYAFISRLLEDAGISFYFTREAHDPREQDEKNDKPSEDPYQGLTKLVLHDAPQKNRAREAPLHYVGHETPHFGADKDYCATVALAHRVRPGKFTVRDFDFRIPPHTNLYASAAVKGGDAIYEQFDYAPGVFWWEPGQRTNTPSADDKGVARTLEKADRDALVTRQEDAERVRRVLVSFHSNAMDLMPGAIVGINQDGNGPDHPHPVLAPDKKLLIVRTSFEGKNDGDWILRTTAVHAENTSRPERRTPRPRILGVQSALVVGPKGQDIHTDEFGRVRVQFHWDREGTYDENSSCWIRVSQAWAGGGFGIINIPRIGHEVLVGFFEGDPDRPVIVGRAHNATTAVPYALPANMTQSGWKSDSSPGGGGYNEIRFDDKKGSEEIHVQAQKDLSCVVNNVETSSIGSSRSVTIGREDALNVGVTHAVRVGRWQSTEVGELHTITVGGHTGTVMAKNGVGFMTTGKASVKLSQKDIALNAEGQIVLQAGKGIDISTASGTIEIQGGPDVVVNPATKGTSPSVEKVGAAKAPAAADGGGTSGPPFKPGARTRPTQRGGLAPQISHLSNTPEGNARGTGANPTATGTTPLPKGIKVKGSPEFQARVAQDLATIGKSDTGQDVLDRIGESGKEVLIAEPDSEARFADMYRGSGPMTLTSATAAALEDHPHPVKDPDGPYVTDWGDGQGLQPTSIGDPGDGANSTILYKPENYPNPTAPKTPSDVVLLHELGHAANISEGKSMAALMDPDKAWQKSWNDFEEHNVVVDVENPYREERDLPTRPDYNTPMP